jgi:hypothetical protein
MNHSSTTTADRGRPAAAAFNAMPQEPKLSTTYVGGRALPNSETELAAYGKAMAEFIKFASYNEAIEGQSRSQNRGQKRSHHGPSGNGNGNYINDSNPDADPDASAQHDIGSVLVAHQARNYSAQPRQTLMGKPIKIRSSRPPTKPWPTRQPNWPTRPPKYGN